MSAASDRPCPGSFRDAVVNRVLDLSAAGFDATIQDVCGAFPMHSRMEVVTALGQVETRGWIERVARGVYRAPSLPRETPSRETVYVRDCNGPLAFADADTDNDGA